MFVVGLQGSISWLQDLLLGPVANIFATLSIALVGLLLLDGRLDWRSGARTIAGCFLIFGAPMIAAGLMNAGTSANMTASIAEEPEIVPPPPRPPEIYDPYAGAAVLSNR